MKKLCLLLLSVTSSTDANYFFASPHRASLANSNTHNHGFHLLNKLSGGDSDGEKPKRRKRRSKSAIRETSNDDDVDATNSDAIADDFPGVVGELNRESNDKRRRDFVSDMFKSNNIDEALDADHTRPGTKKRTRRRRSPASINQDSSGGEVDVNLVQDESYEKRRKRRKKIFPNRTTGETDSIEVEIPVETNEPSSKKRKRRRKKSGESGNSNGGTDESSVESALLHAKQDFTVIPSMNTSDETGKKKRRRKKRGNESCSTTEVKEPAGTHDDEQLVLGSDRAKHDEINESTQSINATIVQKNVTGNAVQEEGNTVSEHSELERVSIDTTIEIPDEEIVPESLYSTVELIVSDGLTGDGGVRDSSEQSEALSISAVDLIHDKDVKSLSSALPDGVFPEEIQSQITTPQDETLDLDLLSSERISMKASVEIFDEEVVPESLSLSVEVSDSLHYAEKIKDVENGSLEMSFIMDSREEPQIELPEPMHQDSNEAREELEKEANIKVEGTPDTIEDTNDADTIDNTDSAEIEQRQFGEEDGVNQAIVDTKDQESDKEREVGNVAPYTMRNKDRELSVEATDIPGGAIIENPVKSETDEDTSEIDKKCLVLSVVTWNLGEVAPSEEDASFIRRFRTNSDLVMIGAQECEEIKPRRTEGKRSRHLRKLGIEMLGNQYVPLAIHSLGGIQMALYCRRERLESVEFIGLADVTCGVGNVFHNKGAIGVYLKLKHRSAISETTKSSKLLLVTGHLAAHVKNVEARNDDFKRIITELECLAPARFLKPRKNRDGSPINSDGSYLLKSMDHVIFSGDLNYRIDLPREYVDRCIDDIEQARLEELTEIIGSRQIDTFNKLLRRDQLLRTISSGQAFANFSEAKIAFLPTFKFDKGSSEYDTSYKQRIPAWTDRIVFKSNSIRVIEYDSVPTAMHSDHRPVFGTYELGWGRSDIQKKFKKNDRR